ncbi:hypothetical protein DF185_13125 [Marinifilum breve]|uniref:RiboL-PSP-HEPN domain-containing protein n=1 Tax=Marinifilum breve TaxID=2184082 RepID=A0A2V3ZWX9_9BACT|nr:HEPN domain-containing protein [Marinifilum breve]PXY00836.1 hypothetical protein DF185_13125 [Marinifilum breve]
MANSRRYNQLQSRIIFLENNILPDVKINGNYTKKESDLIRSYVLLVHAEIESYFEDIAKLKIQKALQDWRSDRKKSNCLLAVMSFCSEEINWERISKEEKSKFDFRVNKTVRHFIDKLDSNHGIKSKNICNILLPIGIEISQLDDVWLGTMDSFGSKRGLFAHSAIQTQSQIDLVVEKNNININILPEIEIIDGLIKNIK